MGTVEKLQIVCAGIGGRGVLLASTILMETAIEAGYKAIASDEYGMSQRGGSVVSLVKIGDFASPLIGREKADLLLAFEESEFYKALYLLKPGGTAVMNTKLSALPSSVSDLLNRRGIRCCFIDADGCAMDHDMVQASNIALLGFLSSLSIGPYTTESIVDTITRKVPQKFLAKNLEIFEAGLQRAKVFVPDISAQRQAPGAPPLTSSPAHGARLTPNGSSPDTSSPRSALRAQPASQVMIGNQAIARGLVEAGVELAAAYPGTPSSEILPGIVDFKKLEKKEIHTEWSTNEKCAFEVAFGAASIGKRTACFMKQVGLNVAFASVLHALERPISGALVIVSCDDPGPQSSQTEQDTRLIASLYGIPVFDPASPEEAADIAFHALNYSLEQHKPVIIRSTHRVSHARQSVPLYPIGQRLAMTGAPEDKGTRSKVKGKDSLTVSGGANSNRSLSSSSHEPLALNLEPSSLGIVASGMSYSLAYDVLRDLGAADYVSLLKIVQINPPDKVLFDFARAHRRVLVLEETDQVIEAALGGTSTVLGRSNHYVPAAGEMTYDIAYGVIARILKEEGMLQNDFAPDSSIEDALKNVNVLPRPPKLCAGCPHRASFFAMKYAFPEAIFPGDIGCYTLGTVQGAVDTFLDMGSGVSFAAGFYDAFAQDNKRIPILASIGDSTFFHACLPLLYDAVQKKKKFVLVIMDNGTTAMTGMQPTPQSGVHLDNTSAPKITIEGTVSGFGVPFLRIVDPYNVPVLLQTIRDALDYLDDESAVPAVIIARRECALLSKAGLKDTVEDLRIEELCTGCRSCLKNFNCPAMPFDEVRKRVVLDKGLCIKCGTCLYACPVQEKGKALKKMGKGYKVQGSR